MPCFDQEVICEPRMRKVMADGCSMQDHVNLRGAIRNRSSYVGLATLLLNSFKEQVWTFQMCSGLTCRLQEVVKAQKLCTESDSTVSTLGLWKAWGFSPQTVGQHVPHVQGSP